METLQQIAITDLRPMPGNRKHGGSANIDELAASIMEQGVIQPLVVRQVNGHYEIVAGERRSRAATKAGLKTVPCVVRELTDAQADEQRLEENLQRADLHPMDEAEAYERLIDAHGYTVEDLADKFSKSQAHVKRRLALCALSKTVRKAYLEGKLEHKLAIVIARMPDKSTQEDLLKRAARPGSDRDWDVEQLQRAALSHTANLSEAPFQLADATLVAKVGACTTCPSRTGQQRELFGEIKKGEEYCLVPKCYAAKVDAWWTVETAKAGDGVKVLSAAEAKDIAAGTSAYGRSKYVRPTEELTSYTQDYSNRSTKSLKTALKKHAPTKILAKVGNEVYELYERKEVNAKLKAAGLLKKATANRMNAGVRANPYKAAEAKRRNQAELDKLVCNRAIAAAVAIAEGVEQLEQLDPLAELLLTGAEATETAKARGYKDRAELDKAVRTMDSAARRGLVVELALRGTTYSPVLSSSAKKALDAWGVDHKAIEREVKAELKAKKKPAKKSSAKKPPAKKPTRSTTAKKKPAKRKAK